MKHPPRTNPRTGSRPSAAETAAPFREKGPAPVTERPGPPRGASRQEKTAGPPEVEWPDADPFDRGVTDLDWPEPEWPDPSWPGFGPSGRPANMFNLAVSPWYKEHYPDKSANLWDALHPGRDPQPGPGPDKSAGWEAGQ
jgi:hypothetical protein